MRRLLRLLVAGSIPWALAAHGAELRVGLAADVTSMDPHFLAIAPNINIAWHVFDALTHVDEYTRLIPGLALSWRAVDATTWEFKLRPGVRFHDGSELTAEDVVFSIERTLKVPNGQYGIFTRRIVGKEVVDAHTLRLKTATPYAMVPYDLNSVFIVSKKAAARSGPEDFDSGKAMVGTGPFRFVRFARGDRVELARNDAYWGAQGGKGTAWETVTLRIVPTDPARLAGLLSGELDAIEQVPTADLPRIRRDARLNTVQKVSWRTIFFYLVQHRDRACRRPRARRDAAAERISAQGSKGGIRVCDVRLGLVLRGPRAARARRNPRSGQGLRRIQLVGILESAGRRAARARFRERRREAARGARPRRDAPRHAGSCGHRAASPGRDLGDAKAARLRAAYGRIHAGSPDSGKMTAKTLECC